LYLESFSDTARNSNQLVLHHDGGVGIGTNDPGNLKLDVTGRIRSKSGGNTPTTGTGLEMFYSPSDNEARILAYDRDATQYKGLALGYTTGLQLYLDNVGNVGIGTKTPVAKLDIRENGSVVEYPLNIANDQSAADGNSVAITFELQDDTPAAADYGRILVNATDVSSSSRDTRMSFYGWNAGCYHRKMTERNKHASR